MKFEMNTYLKIASFLVFFVLFKSAFASSNPIVMKSHSFNAKKKSNFTIDGQIEHLERGLTIIHFQSNQTFEFRTFDTHSSEEDAKKFVETIEQLQLSKATFSVLAHDSAAKNLVAFQEKLKQLGFSQLSVLKGRQAYIMHNLNGNYHEQTDNISTTIELKHPTGISDELVYFEKINYTYEPNNNRYIAHAGGEINEVKSTNSLEALNANYKKGFRLFELDIIETSDGKLVAAHDWNMWSRFTDFGGSLPPSHAEFKKHKIYGDYTTLDLKGINAWFKSHPDAILVTDKINDPIAFADAFVDKNRLIMELFSPMAIEKASKNGIQVMISQQPLMGIVGDKLNYLLVNDIKYVAVSRRIISSKRDFMLKLQENGIKVYVYNVNFDPGKDERYVQDNEFGLIYGMYADKWIENQSKKTTLAK